MTATAAYPPAPWRLRGEAVLVAAPVRVVEARRHPLPPGLRLAAAGGSTLGGVLLARYDETATLAYHELIVFSALARRGVDLAFVVSHIYVDSEVSLAGGREIWGLPKELATFAWSSRAMTVEQDGRRLLSARVRRRGAGGGVPIPLFAPVFGTLGGAAVRAAGAGLLRGAPALAALDIPAASPFAGLALAGTRPALAGDRLDLAFPAPRGP